MHITILMIILAFLTLYTVPQPALTQQNHPCSGDPPDKIYFTRHAEKDCNYCPKPDTCCKEDKELNKQIPLTNPCGTNMAKQLAERLGNLDISAIYTTQYQRTIQTAKPLADIRKLPIKKINEINLVVNDVCENQSDKTILVVGHENTIPELIKEFCPRENSNCPQSDRSIDYCDLFEIDYINGSPVFNRISYCNYNELCGS